MAAKAQDRIEFGRKQRERLGRVEQKELNPKERGFNPLAVLQSAREGRLERLLPIKYARMAQSPFAFFRGAVSIMAADLGRLPNTGIDVQLCGDAHVQNLGSFAAADGKLVFDFNDFDETIRGPFEWDLKRMAASIVLAGREANHKRTVCHTAAENFVARYCLFMREFSRQPILQAARHQIHREQRVRPISAALRQSERAAPGDLLKKFTVPGRAERPRFRDNRPLFWRLKRNETAQVLESLAVYRETLRPESRGLFDLFEPVDAGFKVVGTGSVGMRDYVVLLQGNGPADPLFLQIKQEMPSAYARFLPNVVYEHEGRRAAEGQRAIQPLSDLLLGWTSLAGRQFLVRQLNDHKGSIDLRLLRGGGLESLAEIAGELLARGHARSGDACAIHAYCGSGGKMQKGIGEFARAYADQTEADYEEFQAAIKRGRIRTEEAA